MSLSGQLYCRPTFLSTNLILFVFQKLFSAPKLHLITTIWKYLVKTLSATITHLTHPTSNPSYPFKVNYWFMKSLSQNFEVLTQRANVINPNWLEKGLKLVSHVLMVLERWKSKVKGTLTWGIRVSNYFVEILKI